MVTQSHEIAVEIGGMPILLRTQDGFRVVGTPPSEEELERALREAGAKRGAAVELGEETLEFVP